MERHLFNLGIHVRQHFQRDKRYSGPGIEHRCLAARILEARQGFAFVAATGEDFHVGHFECPMFPGALGHNGHRGYAAAVLFRVDSAKEDGAGRGLVVVEVQAEGLMVDNASGDETPCEDRVRAEAYTAGDVRVAKVEADLLIGDFDIVYGEGVREPESGGFSAIII